MPYKITKDSTLVFEIRNSVYIEFKFIQLIDIKMGLFYFNIAFEKKNSYEPFAEN